MLTIMNSLIIAQMSVTQVAIPFMLSSGKKELTNTMIKTKAMVNLILMKTMLTETQTKTVILTVNKRKKRIIASLCGEKQLQA